MAVFEDWITTGYEARASQQAAGEYRAFIATLARVDGVDPKPLAYRLGDPAWLAELLLTVTGWKLTAGCATLRRYLEGDVDAQFGTAEWDDEALLVQMQRSMLGG